MTDRPKRSPAIEHLHREVENDMQSFYSAFKHDMTDRTDTDTLPPPDGVLYATSAGMLAPRGDGYTAATVRRLLAEAREAEARKWYETAVVRAGEKIAELTEVLQRIVDWDDSGLALTDDHIAQARAVLAKGNTNG